MAIKRVSFPKVIWSKLMTQVGKKENVDLKEVISSLKTSVGTAGAIVIWEPPLSFIERAHEILKKEEGFTRDRQKGGCNHKAMLKTISDLQKYIEEAGTGEVE